MAKPHFDHIRVAFHVESKDGAIVHAGTYWLDDDTERRAFGQRCHEAIRDGFTIVTWADNSPSGGA